MNNQIREDLLITALEGGSNWWYFINDYSTKIIALFKTKHNSFSEAAWMAIKSGKTFSISDAETAVFLGNINLESIKKGEKIMKLKHKEHYANAISENWDAETADVWFQLAVMNELRFG